MPRYRLPSITPSPAKRLEQSMAGRSAQLSGQQFQSQVNAANALYRTQHTAMVCEVPVATRYKQGQLTYAVSPCPVDFMGWVAIPVLSDRHAPIVPVAFDAKVIDGKRLTMAHWQNPKNRLRIAKQVDFLLDWSAKDAGLAGYLGYHKKEHRVYWIPAAALLPFTQPAALAGLHPVIPLTASDHTTPAFATIGLSDLAAVATGRAPLVDWRALLAAHLTLID